VQVHAGGIIFARLFSAKQLEPTLQEALAKTP